MHRMWFSEKNASIFWCSGRVLTDPVFFTSGFPIISVQIVHQVVHSGRIQSTGFYFRMYLEDLGAQIERATKVAKSVVTQSVSAKI